MLHKLKNAQAAVVFIFGQSNAHAHAQAMCEADKITKPMKNVFSLDRNPNQALHPERVVWSGFTTCGKNLAEKQDHTYSFAYYLAVEWQNAINAGAALPDLYIVQMSIGAQGILNGMWNKQKAECLIPGELGAVDISLYPMCIRINKLVMQDLYRRFESPVILGMHWIGSEQDAHPGGYDCEHFKAAYNDFFEVIPSSIGKNIPVYLYKLLCTKISTTKQWSEGISAVNNEFVRQSELHKNFKIISAENSPFWDKNAANLGIFADDGAHYLAKVQHWYAMRFFKEITEDKI